jgi:hypothetical protein
MIIEKRINNKNITVIIVGPDISDEKMEKMVGSTVKRSKINYIINSDCDVYTKDGKLLLKFRKNQLSLKNMISFYDNVIDFALHETHNRGKASGATKGEITLANNPGIMSNIIGYYDTLGASHRIKIRKCNITNLQNSARETRFVVDYPEKYKKAIPLITEIDKKYKSLLPSYHKKQNKKANQTHFRVGKTAFTTITTNVNFQTKIHTDKGDDIEGFGNLVVIGNGYSGGETCFPRYGIGVNILNHDILFMDVHEPHGNLPIKKNVPNACRLSIVCYLRTKLWELTKNKSKAWSVDQMEKVRNLKGC